LNYVQSLASTISAFVYLIVGAWKDGTLGKKSFSGVLGWSQIIGSLRLAGLGKIEGSGEKVRLNGSNEKEISDNHAHTNGDSKRKDSGALNGNGDENIETLGKVKGAQVSSTADKRETIHLPRVAWRKTLPALLLQVSIFQTIAGPIGFLALRHISYPTMVLGKVSSLSSSPLGLAE